MTLAQIGSVLGYLLSPIYYSIYPPAHVDQVFSAGTKGSVVEAEFRVLDAAAYDVYLDLYFKPEDAADRNRVRALSGTGAYSGVGPTAHQIDTGLSIPVHVKINRLNTTGDRIVLDGVFRNHDLESHGVASYRKTVTGIGLPPGNYRLTVVALQDIPELSQTPIHVEMQLSRRK